MDTSYMANVIADLIEIEAGERPPFPSNEYHRLIRILVSENCSIEGGIVSIMWPTLKTRLLTLLGRPNPPKIPAIKQFRAMTGCGLKEAKDIVEALMRHSPKDWEKVMAKFYGVPQPSFSFERVPMPKKIPQTFVGAFRPEGMILQSHITQPEKAIQRTVGSKRKVKKPRLRHRPCPKSKKKKVSA